jgi:hypothetical protein
VSTACSLEDRGPTAPGSADLSAFSRGRGAQDITVMTQNLYPGANLDLVLEALVSPDPTDDLPSLAFALQTFLETDFPTRAAAIADRIGRERPHAVGLQEVFVFDLDVNFGVPVQIYVPFLAILQEQLAARGLSYVVAAQNHNFTLSPFPGITLSDFDVLLVDAGRVTVESGMGHTFTANLPPLGPLQILRGWVTATVLIDGRRYALASAHPEAGHAAGYAELRAAQLAELLGMVPTGMPAIVMGDLNDTFVSPMYQAILAAGFTDVWTELRPGVAGATCCHADDLSEHVARFDQRIDYVFARGFGRPPAGLQGQISLAGEVPADRVAGPVHPLWPSDHAGLIATLLVLPGTPWP